MVLVIKNNLKRLVVSHCTFDYCKYIILRHLTNVKVILSLLSDKYHLSNF